VITRKIRSLKDQTLDTNVDRKQLVKGEVAVVNFLTEPQMMSFVGMGVLELASDAEPTRKVIPVIGERRMADDVVKREVEVPLQFLPGFDLGQHMSSGV